MEKRVLTPFTYYPHYVSYIPAAAVAAAQGINTKPCILLAGFFALIHKMCNQYTLTRSQAQNKTLKPLTIELLVSVQTPMLSTRAFWKNRPMNMCIAKDITL